MALALALFAVNDLSTLADFALLLFALHGTRELYTRIIHSSATGIPVSLFKDINRKNDR